MVKRRYSRGKGWQRGGMVNAEECQTLEGWQISLLWGLAWPGGFGQEMGRSSKQAAWSGMEAALSATCQECPRMPPPND